MKISKKIYSLQNLNFLQHSALNIGVLGGSFDPAHQGHVLISNTALKAFGLDYVIWLITKQNPLKKIHYYDMTTRAQKALAIISNPRILVSIAELNIGYSSTYNIIKFLCTRYSKVKLSWLMGIDNVKTFKKWHRYYDIPNISKQCKIIIFDRPNYSNMLNLSNFTMMFKVSVNTTQCNNIIFYRHNTRLNISSSAIRKQLID